LIFYEILDICNQHELTSGGKSLRDVLKSIYSIKDINSSIFLKSKVLPIGKYDIFSGKQGEPVTLLDH
jgi:hypothetical protein